MSVSSSGYIQKPEVELFDYLCKRQAVIPFRISPLFATANLQNNNNKRMKK
jgi:hypothetical protein